MTTNEACNHEDCDCTACTLCGALIPDGEGVTESFGYQIGDEWESESETFCPACVAKRAAKRAAQEEHLMAHEAYDAEDEIPF